jgi:hypothetical protein
MQGRASLAFGVASIWAACLSGLGIASVGACARAQHREPATAWTLKEMELEVANRGDPALLDRQHVVLMAVDGVRWQDVFHGVDAELAREHDIPASEVVAADLLLPNLYRLARARGTALGAPGYGAPINASGPNFVSLPGYMEMLTGRSPALFANNDCPQIPEPTLLDELVAIPGVRQTDVAVIASWEGVEKAASIDPSRIAISVGRTRGTTRALFEADPVAARLLELGKAAGPGPGHDDFRRDDVTRQLALHYLRSQRPRFLFIGLGETDEYGHREDYRGYLRALKEADRAVADVARVLEEFEREGDDTLLLVTSDHGRADNFETHGAHAPESARVFLFAIGSRFAARGYARAAAPRKLADLAPTLRRAVGLPPDPSLYAGRVLEELSLAPPTPIRRRTVARVSPK